MILQVCRFLLAWEIEKRKISVPKNLPVHKAYLYHMQYAYIKYNIVLLLIWLKFLWAVSCLWSSNVLDKFDSNSSSLLSSAIWHYKVVTCSYIWKLGYQKEMRTKTKFLNYKDNTLTCAGRWNKVLFFGWG